MQTRYLSSCIVYFHPCSRAPGSFTHGAYLVDFLLLGQEVDRVLLLEECIALVLLVGENALNGGR